MKNKNYLNFRYDKGKILVKSFINGAYNLDIIDEFPMSYFIPTNQTSKYKTMNGSDLYPMFEKNVTQYYNQIYKNKQGKDVYGNIAPDLQYILRTYFTKDDILNETEEKAQQFISNFRITFYDIEVYEPRFNPTHTNPVSPIYMISYKYRPTGEIRVLGIRDLTEDLDYYMKFDNEKEMLLYWFSILDKTDLLVGWFNRYFDTPYVFARARYLFKDDTLIRSYLPFECFHFKKESTKFGEKEYVDIPGITEYDYIDLMKSYDKKMKSYKLGYVAQKIIGETKLEYDGKICDFLENEYTKAVKYNYQDTNVVDKIDVKKEHIKKALLQSFQCIVSPENATKQILKWETLFLKEVLKDDTDYLDLLFDNDILSEI